MYSGLQVHTVDCKLHTVDCKVHIVDCKVHIVDCRVHTVDSKVHIVDCRVHTVDSKAKTLQYANGHHTTRLFRLPKATEVDEELEKDEQKKSREDNRCLYTYLLRRHSSLYEQCCISGPIAPFNHHQLVLTVPMKDASNTGVLQAFYSFHHC